MRLTRCVVLQGAVGLELWSMSNEIYFDNFIVTDDRDVADKWAADTWELKHEQELLSSPSGVCGIFIFIAKLRGN